MEVGHKQVGHKQHSGTTDIFVALLTTKDQTALSHQRSDAKATAISDVCEEETWSLSEIWTLALQLHVDFNTDADT